MGVATAVLCVLRIPPLGLGSTDAVPERVARFVERTFIQDFRAANAGAE